MPPYIERDVDGELRERLAAANERGGLVLVRGHSAAGKTRAAFEAMRAVLPEHRVATPQIGTELPVVLEAIGGVGVRCVLWLDGLERFLGPGGLDTNMLTEFERLRIPLLATIRVKPYEIFTPAISQERFLAGDPAAQIGARVLGRVEPLDLNRTWSEQELRRAKASKDERIVDAVAHHGFHGVAEYLAAGPAIWSEWRRSNDVDGAPRGAALVSAAVDLARTGLAGPYSRDLLVELHEHYLAAQGGALLRPEPLAGAFVWAERVRFGVTSPLLPSTEGHWHVFDYLVDGIEQLAQPQPVPEFVWPRAAERVADEYDAMNVALHGALAESNASCATAEALWRPLADGGSAMAAYNLGILCSANDRPSEARELFRKSAEWGEPRAAYNLSLLLREEGADAEADEWNQLAVDADFPPALFNVGLSLEEQGRINEAEEWYRRGADLGEHHAATNLGNILSKAGRTDEAQRWYRQADMANDALATTNIGAFHHQAGRVQLAERWYQRAIARGSVEAKTNLGVLLKETGRPAEAEKLYREAVDQGSSDAAFNLGGLCEKTGRYGDAESWYRCAADAGHDVAAWCLFRLYCDGDRLTEAVSIVMQFADEGDRKAAAAAGELLIDLGRLQEGISYLTVAAESGLSDAAFNLGVAFNNSARPDEAKRWYRQAAESGDAEAAANLADVLFREGCVASAIWWTRRSRIMRREAE
ncbi:tetratricopeptide repeat protein [Actinomadura sp. J1-007]|uniref:tetratricopeptide repeat protein n=1 Tax=Actinomadura sp. J1-007 TaxID=2661913 RepID=UPI0019D57A36|nr:tetratricopeptide repeat protein [Actinomadura sp. J1-007]